MGAVIKKLKSGKIKIIVYTPEYVKNASHVKGIIEDIYKHVEDFDKNIVWIMKVVPNNGKKESDVIKEYFKTEEEKDYITFAHAGMLSSIPATDDINNSLAIIEAEKKLLFGLNFVNTIWNRRMAHIFGNSDYMFYQNAEGKAFVENNVGEDKLIARINTK